MMLEPLNAQVAPHRIHSNDQSNFLDPQPTLNHFLPLNRIPNILEPFKINQTIQFVSSSEIRSPAFFMLAHLAYQIIRNANVQIERLLIM